MNSVAPPLLAIALLGLSHAASAQPATPDGLVVLQVDEQAVAGSKALKMTFREARREADHSVVEVQFTSGASVPSSMFIVKGMCAIMRARGERYFQSEPLGSGPAQYKVTFPRQPNDNELQGREKKVFSEQDCSRLRF
jgi:hypothetical protein